MVTEKGMPRASHDKSLSIYIYIELEQRAEVTSAIQ